MEIEIEKLQNLSPAYRNLARNFISMAWKEASLSPEDSAHLHKEIISLMVAADQGARQRFERRLESRAPSTSVDIF